MGWKQLSLAEKETVLCEPGAITVLPDGDFLVGDNGDQRVKRCSEGAEHAGADTAYVITTIAGSGREHHADGVGREASFTYITGISVNAGGSSCTVVDGTRIRSLCLITNTATTLAGSGEESAVDGVGIAASFADPSAVAVLPDGRAAVVEFGECGIRLVEPVGGETTTLCGSMDGSRAFLDGVRTA
jgi:hypothetical protein